MGFKKLQALAAGAALVRRELEANVDETHPLISEQGNRVEAELLAAVEATGVLNPDELDSVVQVVAASYQKALQLRYVVEALIATPPEERGRLGAGLADVEHLLGTLAT